MAAEHAVAVDPLDSSPLLVGKQDNTTLTGNLLAHVWARPDKGWLLAFGIALMGSGALVLAILAPWPGPPQPQDSVPAPDKLRVLGLDVMYFATVEGRRAPRGRLLGRDSFVTHGDDGVEVAARLSGPAYAFLIAFRPDGTEAVIFPEKDDEAPPRTDRPRFPSVSTDDYGLEEGSGLQAFAVVASNRRYPPSRNGGRGRAVPGRRARPRRRWCGEPMTARRWKG